MHELSIALSIIDVAAEEAERLGGQVTAVHLRLGPLSGVAKEALCSAFAVACAESPLAGARLIVEEMPIVAWCTQCECEQRIASPQRMCCPVCDAPTPEVRGGREMEIFSLEIVDDAADPHG